MTLSFSFELPPAVRGSVSAAFTHTPAPRRIIVAISDASCAVYGARLLQVLQGTPGIETHLIASEAGWHSIEHELDLDRDFIEDMADEVHDMHDIGSTLGSSTFACSGMVIAPCSAGTLASVAHGMADNLVTRVADLMLQERRRLVLLTRESPLHLTHLRNMVSVTEMGGIICPAVPAFCLHPQTVGDIVNHGVGRVLDLLDVPHTLTPR
ncbi:MAG: 3-octaprenyl-4-hydroxybenzoate carboxy-lyase, partial [Polaromonas sp.]|nr:3-octaprenyl-4-hydroxybenzoate carboxy-lyase [Polaromonas sp.]